MTARFKRKPIRKYQIPARVEISPQAELFNLHSDPAFNFEVDAKLLPYEGKIVVVQNMRIKLSPPPKRLQTATGTVVEALRIFNNHVCLWLESNVTSRCWDIAPEQSFLVDRIRLIKVSERSKQGSPRLTIKADYDADTKILSLSLPHESRWSDCGLGWMWSHYPCCERSAKNPRPWAGKTCDCQRIKRRSGVSSRNQKRAERQS
ncbi:hypothetical protein Q9Q94_06160 [Uliginosibacterium sp. 31-16]|uniref:hypothetical protein n=1 Tax=Uliginosibacterium sp. 31-16 TaxID=3068315 RepID=UPI00273E731A|nr:hypothetical protein [Uliginosibacterium sp. 31-16]MDP5239106.1 hypothetical protein [Uliginosibacterium sp. 31-16]